MAKFYGAIGYAVMSETTPEFGRKHLYRVIIAGT